MNIYFACSITGGREFESVYKAIVDALASQGHVIPTAHLAEPGLTSEAALSPLQPVARAVFAGRLDPEKLSWLQNWMIKQVKSPIGDFRDWTAIAAWARELPGKLDV